MRTLDTDIWKRRGITLLFDDRALAGLAETAEVVSVRRWVRMAGHWPDDLPSNHGRAIVVAGLGACLDLLAPDECEEWISRQWTPTVASFQAEFDGEAACVFWVPDGRTRIRMNVASETYTWACAPPHKDQALPLGRLLWAGAESGVARIVETEGANGDPDGPAWSGLYQPRIS